MSDFRPREYGRCPECGKHIQLTIAGRLGYHRVKRTEDHRWGAPDCDGYGMKPVSEVPDADA